MRVVILAAVAAMLLLPGAAPAKACFEAVQASIADGVNEIAVATQATTTDLSAMDEKKPAKSTHKKRHKKPKEKVEYMRAAPSK